jgi:hypothetical protein
MKIKSSCRIHANNGKHHLWNNNGTWWFHLTVRLPDFTKYRLRTSLKTNDIEEAKRVRDFLLMAFAATQRPIEHPQFCCRKEAA